MERVGFPYPSLMAENDLLDRAEALLNANTQHQHYQGQRYRFAVPSLAHYPFQWLWDSCFHACLFARRQPARGLDELRALLSHQRADGFIPHVIFWNRDRVRRLHWHTLEANGFVRKPLTSALTQPPIIAQALSALAGSGCQGWADLLPAADRYYRYLTDVRDPDRDGLISTFCSFETGLDYSSVYDSAVSANAESPSQLFYRYRLNELHHKLVGYRPDRIFSGDGHSEDVLVNTILADALETMAELHLRLDNPSQAASYQRSSTRTLQALCERCYDPDQGLFFPLHGRNEQRGSVKTVSSLFPLLLRRLPGEIVSQLLEHLTDPKEFWPSYPIPSVALDEPTFSSDSRIGGYRFIWRGPLSMNSNWLIAQGLRRHGQEALAEELAAKSRELAIRHGFNEFYSPLDGRPVGQPEFGWATLAAII